MSWLSISSDTEEEPLRQTFVDCGDIEAVRIVRDNKTGAGKGFGFILFKVNLMDNCWSRFQSEQQ